MRMRMVLELIQVFLFLFYFFAHMVYVLPHENKRKTATVLYIETLCGTHFLFRKLELTKLKSIYYRLNWR